MADFEQQREELGAWRRESEDLRRKLLLAREGAKRGRGRDAEVAKRLERQARDLAARGDAIWDGFRDFVDPKATLRRLDDRHPILLFPLRLETRFKASASGTPRSSPAAPWLEVRRWSGHGAETGPSARSRPRSRSARPSSASFLPAPATGSRARSAFR